MAKAKHVDFTENETKVLKLIAGGVDKIAACEAVGVNRNYVNDRVNRNPKFAARFNEIITKQTNKAAEATGKELCKFDPIAELRDIAQSWRQSDEMPTMVHEKACVDYAHLSGDTPEAKKMLAEIQSRIPGGAVAPDGDFTPDWAQRVN